MIVERLEIAVLDGREAAFEAALLDVRQGLVMTRGFRGFTVAQSVDQPSSYLVQVLWETVEEHADFADSDRFGRCWAPVGPFLAGPPRAQTFAQRDGLTFRGPGVITDWSGLSYRP
jgi:heme-degrading monooxygenase HmoA